MSQSVCEITHYDELREVANSVNRIVQDGEGMIWIATNNGLCRYDGYGFEVFKSHAGDGSTMPSDNISNMYLSRAGGLWCSVGNRAFLFSFKDYRFIDALAGLEKNSGKSYSVTKIRSLNNNTTWLLCDGGECIAVDDRDPEGSARVMMRDISSDCFITNDSRGRSWIADGSRTFMCSPRHTTLFKGKFRQIVSSGGVTWLVSGGGKLCYYDEGRKTVRLYDKVEIPEEVTSLIPMSDNRLAVITRRHLCVLFISDASITCDDMTYKAKDIRENIDGDLWVLTREGEMLIFKKGRLSDRLDAKQLVESHWHEDRFGTMWFIARDGSISYIDHGSLQIKDYPAEEYLMKGSSNFVSDSHDNVWFRSRNGVTRLTFRQRDYEMLPQEKAEEVRAMYTDSKGRFWVAGKDYSSVRVFDARRQPIGYLGRDGALHPSFTSFGSKVYSVCQTSDGDIWLGCKPDGLFRLREGGGRFAITHFDRLLNDNDVYGMAQDKRGRLWVVTLSGGPNCITNPSADNPEVLNKDNGLKGYNPGMPLKCHYIYITSDEKLLVGASEGLLVADIAIDDLADTKFKLHRREADRAASLSRSDVTGIAEDSRHRIFVCTGSGGVNMIESKNLSADCLDFRHLDAAAGLGTDIARDVFESNGRMWIISLNRIIGFDLKDDGAPEISVLLQRDNMQFSEAAPAVTPDGKWAFGLTQGAAVVDLKKANKENYVPALIISSAIFEGRRTDYSANASDTIVLRSDERSVTINFATLNYSGSRRINYAFRLGGGSDQWSYLGTGHTLSLPNLQPGSYQLYLKSSNGEGQWVDNTRKLTIIVTPTFWQSGFGRTLIILLLLSVASAIYYTVMYIRRIRRQHKEVLEAYLLLLDTNKEAKDEVHAESHRQEVIRKANIDSQNDAFMKRVMAFVEENIGNADISVDDMASASATSRSGLNRKMKQIFGITPVEFIKEARLHKAKDLLSTTDMNINDVAYACGFSDPKYFSRCFKAAEGMTPSEFKTGRIEKKE